MWSPKTALYLATVVILSAVARAQLPMQYTVNLVKLTTQHPLSEDERRQISAEVRSLNPPESDYESVAAAATESVQAAFMDRGYVKAKASSHLVAFDKATNQIDLSVDVQEGVQYRLESIVFTGGPELSASELRALRTTPERMETLRRTDLRSCWSNHEFSQGSWSGTRSEVERVVRD